MKTPSWFIAFQTEHLSSLKAIQEVFRQETVRYGLLGFVFFGVMMGGIQMPINHAMGQLRVHIEQQQKELDLVNHIQSRVQEIDKYSPLFPRKNEVGWWLNTLSDLGQHLGLRIETIHPRSVDELGDYELLSIDLGFHCSYTQLEQFLHALEKMDRLIRVDSVRLQRDSKGGGSLQAALTVSTLALK